LASGSFAFENEVSMSTARRTNPPPPLDEMSPAQFRKRVKDLRQRYPAMTDPVKKGQFESWEEVVDLFQNFDGGLVENGSSAKLAQRRKRPHRAIPVRKAVTSNRAPTRSNATSSFSDLVKPGIYEGPPWRLIIPRFKSDEIDYRNAKFRRQKRGVGKCTGSKLKQVSSSFAFGYVLCESARRELRNIQQNPEDARILWHASAEHSQASLAFWFGADPSNAQMSRMLHKIEDMLAEWAMAFCAGFRNILPVYIRCKSRNSGRETNMARHVVKNTIELMPRYFDTSQARQDTTLLHEMGHRCKSLLKPRDERHSLCFGGWNSDENMCYRDTDRIRTHNSLYRAGNPRALAMAATAGDASARKALLNNIDNYVCYMWNRYVDHGERVLDVMPPQTKPSKPRPSSGRTTTAPSSG
jgi:hypothetical protein